MVVCGAVPGVGVTAAVLVGFNQNLLLRMQEGAPTTVALCGILGALLAYGWREQLGSASRHLWPRAGPTSWAVIGGLALGLALLALGGLGLLVIPIVFLHQYYLRAAFIPASQRKFWWSDRQQCTALIHGLLALAVASMVFLPWFLLMVRLHGWRALASLEVPPEGLLADHRLGLLPRLIELAPAILPLALFGVVRAMRSALVDETNSRVTVGGSFWIIWLGVAALAPAVWLRAPSGELELVLLIPLCMLAAQSIADLVNRAVPMRALIWLAPATMLSVLWWASVDLRNMVENLFHGRGDATTALSLHLVADLALVSVWALHALYRWARRRDDHQRLILATFLLIVIAITIGEGLHEVLFRHDATRMLLSLRTVILRRNPDSPFHTVAVVSPQSSIRATDQSQDSR